MKKEYDFSKAERGALIDRRTGKLTEHGKKMYKKNKRKIKNEKSTNN